MRRSRLATPGAFVPITSLTSAGASCTLCHRLVLVRGWAHIATSSIVCDGCLPDPWTDDGEAGRKLAARLEELARLPVEEEWLPEIY